ncbi:ZNFX1 [Cordylochernes scorpioides]|uniref:ZNFX1 n=1 Tax=Cordylochernes scorpioides TaxID=51811 RepID=A0ABY6K7B7_9ARAC|nr:ZNFX1 [Cordylochernes scorpioides]
MVWAESPSKAEEKPVRLGSKAQPSAEITAKDVLQNKNPIVLNKNQNYVNPSAGSQDANSAAPVDLAAIPTSDAAAQVRRNWADITEEVNPGAEEGFTLVQGRKRRRGSANSPTAAAPSSNPGGSRTIRRPQPSAGSVPRAQEIRVTRAHIAEARARQASSSEEHCVYIEDSPELEPFHYLRALDRMLGGTAGVIQITKVNGHQLLGLTNRGLAERLISEGLEVEGTLLRAFPFRKRAERITVGNLPFFVADSAVITALSPYGRVTSIAPKQMKAGPYVYVDGRRDVFITLHEGITIERLPTRLDINIKGEAWPAYLSSGIRCSRCHGQGHRRAICPLLAGLANNTRMAPPTTHAPPQRSAAQPPAPTPSNPAMEVCSAPPVARAALHSSAPRPSPPAAPAYPMEETPPAPPPVTPAPSLRTPGSREPAAPTPDVEMSIVEETFASSTSSAKNATRVDLDAFIEKHPSVSFAGTDALGLGREEVLDLLSSMTKTQRKGPLLSPPQCDALAGLIRQILNLKPGAASNLYKVLGQVKAELRTTPAAVPPTPPLPVPRPAEPMLPTTHREELTPPLMTPPPPAPTDMEEDDPITEEERCAPPPPAPRLAGPIPPVPHGDTTTPAMTTPPPPLSLDRRWKMTRDLIHELSREIDLEHTFQSQVDMDDIVRAVLYPGDREPFIKRLPTRDRYILSGFINTVIWRTRDGDPSMLESMSELRKLLPEMDPAKVLRTLQYFADKQDNHPEPKPSKYKDSFPKIGIKFFKELLDKDAVTTAMTLRSKTQGFQHLFRTGRPIMKDFLQLILKVVAKACEQEDHLYVRGFLKEFPIDEFVRDVQAYLVAQSYQTLNLTALDPLEHLIKFLSAYMSHLESEGSMKFAVLKPFIQGVLDKLKKCSYTIPAHVTQQLEDLEVKKNSFMTNVVTYDQQQMRTKEERLHSQAPPDNFRIIDIFPTKLDLEFNEKPFLRTNIARGKYRDVEHYLDVQFRLLREDYVRPLREGISHYKLTRNVKKKSKVVHLRDIRVYHNVKIIQNIPTEAGIVTVLNFDLSGLKNVKWETSKRLLHSSLVCLTYDDFETFHFATVAVRKPEFLKKGFVEVQLENLTADHFLELATKVYTMVETSAYFEAYRHVLKGLQTITEEKFPFKRYIVDAFPTIDMPDYLKDGALFDLRPLLNPLPKEPLKEMKQAVVSPNYNILKLESWPSKERCGLDEAQYHAMQAALTKELAIIQGPPGTGKTFIGLRIMQLLLHNKDVWKTGEEEKSPILIVCYTNHALDQFLEGILAFTTNLIRVGGRSKNESLYEYQVSSQRQKRRHDRKVPSHILSNLYRIKDSLKETEIHINTIEEEIREANSRIVKFTDLEPFMLPDHAYYLKSSLDKWLVVSNEPVWDDEEDIQMFEAPAAQVPQAELEEGEIEDEEEEVDIEMINSMREVDLEDFKHDYDFLRQQDRKPEKDGWKKVAGPSHEERNRIKSQRNVIINKLKSIKRVMSDDEAQRIDNVWQLPHSNRWRLYQKWVNLFIWDRMLKMRRRKQEYLDLVQELKVLRMEEDIFLAMEAEVVGMTTSGAAKYRHIVERLASRIVIVEEAAEVLEAHILTSLTSHVQHLILIGDHQQLRPSPTVYELAKKYNLELSLFERLVNNKLECFQLVTQHRMKPCISQLLVPHIYPELRNAPSVEKYEDIKGIDKSMFFLDHAQREDVMEESRSHSNIHEQKMLLELAKYIVLQGYNASQLTVLTTYSSQMFAIKKLFKSQALTQDIHITVVDNFQGEENDIILVSFVRSNEDGNIGFLKTANRVCVALSRARQGLYCIGNFTLMSSKTPLWNNIVGYLTESQNISNVLKLRCQQHTDRVTEVRREEDFRNVKEGGCDLPCNYRLECGHSCTRMCHIYDRDHVKFQCNKVCNKVLCDNGHRCNKKCFQECGKCKILVDKVLPVCKHTQKLPCFQKPETAHCQQPCPILLSCGHQCNSLCSQTCPPCSVLIEAPTLCGHTIKIMCSEKNKAKELSNLCKKPCKQMLACEHMCKGTCGKCYHGRIHQPCEQRCDRPLICNHSCQESCSMNCPPCKRKCENFCQHSRCPLPCGVPCTPCMEKCNWHCPHLKCTLFCYEVCNRKPCNKPCPKKLKCGHPCIGFCGEPCPRLCAVHDKEELTQIFFGSEDEKDARFVLLEDCKHIFESEGLARWFEESSSREIQLPTCPRCKTPVRRNYRFGSSVKKALSDLHKVKEKIFGTAHEVLDLKENLLQKIDSITFENSSYLGLESSSKIFCSKILNDLVTSKNDLKKKKVSKVRITFLHNILNLITRCAALKKKPEFYHFSLSESTSKNIGPLYKFYQATMTMVEAVLSAMYFQDKSYNLEEIEREYIRLENILMIAKWDESFRHHQKYPKYFEAFSKLVVSYQKFSPATVKEIKNLIEKAKTEGLFSTLAITQEERSQILKALNLAQGHWFRCPNGHYYVITECGGAMQEGRCNECQATIGGGSHNIRSDNSFGGEMDGARHPAFSNMANIQNFDPLQFLE